MTYRYFHNKRWRRLNPKARQAQKKRYRERNRSLEANVRNERKPWVNLELRLIRVSWRPVDRVLSRFLGRSIEAIQVARAVLKQARKRKKRDRRKLKARSGKRSGLCNIKREKARASS